MIMKALFLDRDGIINIEKDNSYVCTPDEFFLNESIIDLLKYIRSKGYLIIVISNQGGIAKNLYTKEDVEAIHEKMNTILAKENLFFDEIYYCPHHPDTGRCLCRKPGTLFFEKAIARYEINPSLSYFIGDRDSDEEAGKRAGLTPIKVEANRDLSFLKKMIS